MKPSSGLARKPLKRGRRKPRPSLHDFHEAVTRDPCALGPVGCLGRLWGHHYIPKQRFPDGIYAKAATDPRNGVALCIHHHAQVENARIVCPRPPLLDEFLAEHNIYERERAA